MTDETKIALLSKLRAPVADERQGDIAAGLQDSAYCAGLQRGFMLGNHNDNDGLRQALESRDGYVKTIKDARDARASAPVAGEAQRLDAPAQVGGTRFGKGIHWSTVIHAAQRHHEYMQDPAREAERIALAKEFRALVAGDAAPQDSEAVRQPDYTLQHADHMAVSAERLMEAINARDALIMQREESDDVDDETMHDQHENVSEYLSGMRNAIYEYRKRRNRAALSAQPGAQKNGGGDA